MPKAEGLTLSFTGRESIRVDFLETIDYCGQQQEIILHCREFSAVCPFSGLPDLGTVEVTYIPNDKIIELKSLKYYLISYRQVGIYQEEVTDQIAADLWRLLTPRYLQVTTTYATRGGIDARCTIERGSRGEFSR